MKIDLHSHSFYSDGVLSPSEVIKLASHAGCELFSLTDHDTTEGSAEAKLEADKLNLSHINGVEISAFWRNMAIHILGLGIDINNDILQTGLEHNQKLRKERAEKQRNFLEQIKLEKKIDQFRKREALEIKSLEKYVLSQQRESYEEVQQRIDKIKEKYKSLREQKINEAIRERVASLGITVEDTDDKATLLEKERIYNEERQKIEYALESFYRSAHSLCFQLNKKYIPKYLSIIRCIDKRFETGEIYIKWDDSIEEDWLILIYIKNNSPDEGIIIEDKSNPEKHMTYEFQSNEIFKASDVMVDALTKLLDNERNKRKVN